MTDGKQKVTSPPALLFCSPGLHLLFETEAEEEGETHLFGHTYLHQQQHSPFHRFTSEISIKSERGAISLPALPIFFLHNASNQSIFFSRSFVEARLTAAHRAEAL